MKKLVSLIMVQFFVAMSAFASGQQGELELIPQGCISVDEAHTIAIDVALAELKLCETPQEYYDGDCDITEDDLIDSVMRTRWDNKKGYYRTGIMQNYYCAPGAQCWWGYAINCEGKVGKWSGGED